MVVLHYQFWGLFDCFSWPTHEKTTSANGRQNNGVHNCGNIDDNQKPVMMLQASTLNPHPSTFNPQPSALNPHPPPLFPQHMGREGQTFEDAVDDLQESLHLVDRLDLNNELLQLDENRDLRQVPLHPIEKRFLGDRRAWKN